MIDYSAQFSPSISLTDSQTLFGSKEKLALLQIHTAFCEALISFQGAQLLQFRHPQKQPWLYLDTHNTYQRGAAIIGGIPICLPWFGRHQHPQFPIHGYLQNQVWQLVHTKETAESICLVFCYQHQKTSLFPFCFEVIQRIVLSSNIQLQIEITNQQNQVMPLSFAWHSYFSTHNHANISGLEQCVFLDNQQQLQPRFLAHAIQLPCPIDAVFEHCTLTQTLNNHDYTLQIHSNDCPSCIIWQPKTANNFVCIERGAAFANSLQLAANSRVIFHQLISESPCL